MVLMKLKKSNIFTYLLVSILFMSSIIQLTVGFSFLLSRKAATKLFNFQYQPFYDNDPGFALMVSFVGLCLLVFAFFSLLTVYLVLKKNPVGIILGFASGYSLIIAGIIFYYLSQNPTVISDSIRGLLIAVSTHLYKYHLDKEDDSLIFS